MEIRRWLLCVVVNCVIVTNLVAKPVSLNELIAAEAKQKQEQHTKPTANKPAKTVSLNQLIAAESKQKDKKSLSTKSATKLPKTVSLNELIAAESQRKDKKVQINKTGVAPTTKPVLTKESSPSESRQNLERTRFSNIFAKQPRRQTFSLKDLFATEKISVKQRIENLLSRTSGGGLRLHRSKLPTLSYKPLESVEHIFSLARTISPLKFRKRFEIRSPLKPKKIKYSFTPRNKRRNQSAKREADQNAVFNPRHIPLIKRIGLLVDGILSPDSSESLEPVRRRKPRRNQKLSGKADLASSESKPQKKTAVTPTTLSPTTADTEDPTSEATDTTAYTTTVSDLYALRPNTDLSLPLTGNPSSDRGDHHGVSEGSSTTFHGGVERHIARYNGSDKYNSGGRNQTYSPHNAEDSTSSTRIDKRSDGYRNGTDTGYRDIHKAKTEEAEIEHHSFFRRNDTDAKTTLQIGGETLQIPRNVRRLPGLPDKVFVVDAEPVPPQKSGEESFLGVSQHHASTERGIEWNGTATPEDQRLRQVIQGIIPINDILDPDFLKQRTQDNHVVAIFDGYSVARDINGRNKLTEKSIRISPN